MKATGIIRRIDELGRITIPKDLQRSSKIKPGDPIEFFTMVDGAIVLQPYEPIGLKENIKDMISAFNDSDLRISLDSRTTICKLLDTIKVVIEIDEKERG